MNDIDDAQIKAEIDSIVKGVKNIMKKVDALKPKEESEQDPAGDRAKNPDLSNNNLSGKE